MSGACSTHRRDEKGVQNFGWHTLEDLDIDGDNIKINIGEIGSVCT